MSQWAEEEERASERADKWVARSAWKKGREEDGGTGAARTVKVRSVSALQSGGGRIRNENMCTIERTDCGNNGQR